MFRHPAIFVALVALVSTCAELASAEPGYRKTLLQWSYGTSFDGGPDVYEPLVTDRPDFTEASVTVGYGVAQLECGYTFTYNDDGGERQYSHSFPESLLRLGMFADWFELRLDYNYLDQNTEVAGVGDNTSGSEDPGIGCKIGLTPQECILPETAIIFQSTVPAGDDVFTAEEMLPGMNFLYSWEINDDWSTGASTGISRDLDSVTGEPYALINQSWTVNHSLSERVGSYAEWFMLAVSGADTDRTQHYFNSGLTVLITNDLQWDIRAGVGLNEASDDFFAGSGLSVRYW